MFRVFLIDITQMYQNQLYVFGITFGPPYYKTKHRSFKLKSILEAIMSKSMIILSPLKVEQNIHFVTGVVDFTFGIGVQL